MKKFLLAACAATFLFSGCKKEDENCGTVTTTADTAQVAALQQYLDDNSLTATPDSHGFFYNITNPGTGDQADLCSTIKINYTGKLVNGSSFDAANGAELQLKNLIKGWQLGIPLIKEGGSIILYLPPDLGYGGAGSGSIPPNANLIFTIDLLGTN